jgi:hypothetical protein
MKPTAGIMVLSIKGNSNCVDDSIFKVIDDGLDTEFFPAQENICLEKFAGRKYFLNHKSYQPPA